MSYDDYSPPPSGTFARSPSIDYTMPSSYEPHETGPNMSSVVVGNSELQVPVYGQRAVASDQFVGSSPVLSDVRPAINSSNQITDGISNRSWDPTRGQPQGFSDLVHKNISGNAGNITADRNSESQPPSLSNVAQRDRSNIGGSDDPDSVNPLDYAGISLVGKKFKLVNPEAYYVEKDNPPTDFN